ncbi:hypothetical protein EV189_1660 [Motilibacter rhizosphaerae]|uniref:Uncharacterized protein n=1 Tax=Motilibacter rhizosphaerae TaxID=598652 RepID=A0A4Q7NRZ5_9ACTN|nr:hypothetical protein EV189_1660 [Motilibacter rhizosphaerae]
MTSEAADRSAWESLALTGRVQAYERPSKGARGVLYLPEEHWAWQGRLWLLHDRLLARSDAHPSVPQRVLERPLSALNLVESGSTDLADGYVWRFRGGQAPLVLIPDDGSEDACSRLAAESARLARQWGSVEQVLHLPRTVSHNETPLLQVVR